MGDDPDYDAENPDFDAENPDYDPDDPDYDLMHDVDERADGSSSERLSDIFWIAPITAALALWALLVARHVLRKRQQRRNDPPNPFQARDSRST